MARSHQTAERTDDDQTVAAVREPNLLRFGLRQLFLFVSAAAALCAVLAGSGLAWRIVIGSFAALAAAHVFGTMVGTRLRDTSADVQRWKATRPGGDRDDPIATPPPFRLADLSLPAESPLALYQPAGRRRAFVVGMALGLAAGAAGIHWGVGKDVTWPELALGSVSCGVIGAWIAMLGTSFWTIARHTWRDASAEDRKQSG